MDKVMFISSTGGHLNELMQLKEMFANYDYSILTEKTKSNEALTKMYPGHIHFKSFYYFCKIKPKVIITTGTHTAVPMCYIAKCFGSKVIFIETFANRTTKTLAGKLVYPIADVFIVQWENMLKLYPKAIYLGWIY